MSDSPPANEATKSASSIITKNDKNADIEAITVTPPEMPIEWTKLGEGTSSNSRPIRYPSDVMEISTDPEETYLEIIGTAGQKVTNMGKDLDRLCSPNITHLILRSHLITKMEGFSAFQKLELLELYDNAIEVLDGLDAGNNVRADSGGGEEVCCVGETLKTLDMSYNVIRDMDPVKFCPNLVELYLANNKLKTISGLKHLSSLRKIDLGANRIRVMDESELSGLTNLEELWLGKNKIEKIDGLSSLTKLRCLDVQSNRLTTVDNLTAQTQTLEELYLAHNGIDNEGAMQETGLALDFKELITLDLSKNRLTTCQPFEHMTTLTALWISSNDIATFQDVDSLTALGTREGACLEEIYLEHNPIYKDADYRIKLKDMIPSLNQIDADIIRPDRIVPKVDLEQVRKWQGEALAKAKEEIAQKAKK